MNTVELEKEKRTVSHAQVVKLCLTGMMTAIVFAGNFLRVTMQVPLGGVTSFTLANILCALSGLLLGPVQGFLAAGLGSGLYDLTNPNYVAEAPITLLTKGMYGLVAGLVLYLLVRAAKERGPVMRENYLAQLAATACAAVGYMVVYSFKVFFYNGYFINQFTSPVQSWALVLSKLPATLVNGGIAIVFAPILGVALMKALKKNHIPGF